MSPKFTCLACVLISFKLFAGVITSDITCTIQNSKISSIAFKGFKAGTQAGASPLKEALFTIGEKVISKTSVSGLSMGRSSWVQSDLKDNRPAATIDFEGENEMYRLAFYYCSGNENNVEAKLFSGKVNKLKTSNFESSQMAEGSCTGNQIREVFTNNCSALN